MIIFFTESGSWCSNQSGAKLIKGSFMINKNLFVTVFCLLLVSPYSVAGEWVSDPINGCKVWSDDRADARKGKEIIPELKRSRSVIV